MENHEMSPNEYLAVLKRRRWSFILPVVIVIMISAVVAMVLPPVYRSVSTILIEGQEIPADFVMATVTSYAEQRLQTIHQRIMSTTRLLEIINRLDLYKDLRQKATTEEVIEKMREDISLDYISAEVVDRRTGRPATATIAFTLSYESKEKPSTVQKVSNILASLFLEENLQVRERQALEATSFLEELLILSRAVVISSSVSRYIAVRIYVCIIFTTRLRMFWVTSSSPASSIARLARAIAVMS